MASWQAAQKPRRARPGTRRAARIGDRLEPELAGPQHDRAGVHQQLGQQRRPARSAPAAAWPTASMSGSPSSRRAMWSSQRSEGASPQCRSSTAAASGRRAGGVGREPVEAVQHRERRLAGRGRLGEPRLAEERRREAGRAGEQLRALLRGRGREQRLEELADDPEGELALELAAARPRARESRARPPSRAPRRAVASCRSRRCPRSTARLPLPSRAAFDEAAQHRQVACRARAASREAGRRTPAPVLENPRPASRRPAESLLRDRDVQSEPRHAVDRRAQLLVGDAREDALDDDVAHREQAPGLRRRGSPRR